MIRIIAVLLIPAVLVACGPRDLVPDAAIECERCADWNAALDPFRIHGNTWYVGTDGLSAILIETGDGLVLIDGGLPQSAARIEGNIRELGFDAHDIVAILVSHPHYDHAGGINALQRMTGASVYTSAPGVATLSSGRLQQGDPQFVAGSDDGRFPPVGKVTAASDGERLVFGGVGITAVYTPGHTAGSVTWTWQSCALGTCYAVVYADSLTPVSAPGFSFGASGAAEKLIESAGTIADLECDILLSPHPFFFGLHDKLERIDTGNPFVNDLACTFYAEDALGWLEQRLAAEGREAD